MRRERNRERIMDEMLVIFQVPFAGRGPESSALPGDNLGNRAGYRPEGIKLAGYVHVAADPLK
jgi:hypothetical protein